MSEMLPLFPLGTVLMPGGRLSLRVFEQRYLSLIKQCLRDETVFGIVLINEGSEVAKPGSETELEITGVTARIVDWDTTPDGLLGITVEGEDRFSIVSSHRQADGLIVADVEYWVEEDSIPLPEDVDDLIDLLAQLAEHPHIKRMGVQLGIEDANALSNCLVQLLPLPEQLKYEMLEIGDAIERLDFLYEILDEMSEEGAG